MKNLIKKTIFSGLLLLIASSCNVLDITPVDSITQDKFWNTPDEAAAAAVGINDGLQTVALWSGVWGDLRADVYSSTRGNLVQELVDVMRNRLNPGLPFTDWGRLYVTIGRANWMLANLARVNNLSEAQRSQFTGEATFARAFSYYYAVRLWGDVPLVTEPYTSATQDFMLPRNPKAQVLAQIETDIAEAVAKLPPAYGSPAETKGRPTRWAALALQTDFSLWMAKAEGKPEYFEKAIAAADQIITAGNFSLVPTASYRNIFSAKNTAESIYEIQFNNTQNELQDAGNGASNSPAALTSYAPFGSFNRLLISEKLLAAFEPGDARVPAVTLDVDSSFPKFTKYLGTPTGVQQVTFYDANIVIYRLADIILLRAEALNDLGRTAEAITELDRIRARAGLTPTTALTQAEVKEAILKERFVELAAEGKRWFDLVRNGLVTRELTDISRPENILWPINENVLNANPALEQNGFYR
jgi:starch-binding outer membrane protein, SusD/RagB family